MQKILQPAAREVPRADDHDAVRRLTEARALAVAEKKAAAVEIERIRDEAERENLALPLDDRRGAAGSRLENRTNRRLETQAERRRAAQARIVALDGEIAVAKLTAGREIAASFAPEHQAFIRAFWLARLKREADELLAIGAAADLRDTLESRRLALPTEMFWWSPSMTRASEAAHLARSQVRELLGAGVLVKRDIPATLAGQWGL